MELQCLYNLALILIFIFAGVTFLFLFLLTAPYGRYLRKGWGPSFPAKAAWITMEAPAVFVILIFFILGKNKSSIYIVFIIIWQIHYVHRTFIYPFLTNSKKKFPILLVIFAIFFNTLNGFVNGYYLFFLSSHYTIRWLFDPRFIIGVLVFIFGMIINIHSDRVLRNLRKPGETEYKIPQKGLHRLIASPNYFGEILEWIGWAILTWSIPGLSFAVFTIANLMPRAYSNYKWYRKTFTDYPQKRKALIPYIF